MFSAGSVIKIGNTTEEMSYHKRFPAGSVTKSYLKATELVRVLSYASPHPPLYTNPNEKRELVRVSLTLPTGGNPHEHF